MRSGPLEDSELDEMIAALELDPDMVEDAAWVDNGPGWAALLLRSVDDVMAVEPPSSYSSELDVGVVAVRPEGSETAIEVRAFFSTGDGTILEDPATGSLNASVAQWLIATGRVEPPFVASQGGALGRRGRVHLSQDADGAVWVAGDTTTVATGEIDV